MFLIFLGTSKELADDSDCDQSSPSKENTEPKKGIIFICIVIAYEALFYWKLLDQHWNNSCLLLLILGWIYPILCLKLKTFIQDI